MTTNNLPAEEGVRELLSSLFGADVSVEPTEANLAADGTSVLATYCDEEGEPKRTIACDVEFANRAGASLTMFPAGGADDAIAANEVLERHLENLSEILNICVNLFAETSSTRLVLGDVVSAEEGVSEKLSELQLATTTTFQIDIPRYGSGMFSLSSVE